MALGSTAATLVRMSPYRQREIESLEHYAQDCDEEIERLQARIKEVRAAKRKALREIAKHRDDDAYDAYVGCVTCFPYRDFEAAAAAKGEHSCGLSAAERQAILKRHFS